MIIKNIQEYVLYQDDMVIVLNKLQGIPVHPGPRRMGPSLEDYFMDLAYDYHHPPHLAHRLDRDTSGCLILGRHQKALKRLGKLFESGVIKKTYWALVHGGPSTDEGVVDNWLEKIKTPKGWYMQVCVEKQGAQRAVTGWKVLKREKDHSFIAFYPQTGRTHQIRVHCQFLGCPIIGDWVYSDDGDKNGLLRLHARAIEIPLYEGKPAIRVEAPCPFSLL